ncbi:hypothetical protein HMPREF0204_14637 [Chryseobacterium gleum ATCC 35910]|uniref:Uncharacterized protein n=1 Tax=Chryseobacterium gleum ATCC 35910 TaxID=525257 RepID=A0ABN0AR98_CHRGE|nr:hypothetical protein HMPREF0204_14637 [Chryseobacterium gleum ATCC 35910]
MLAITIYIRNSFESLNKRLIFSIGLLYNSTIPVLFLFKSGILFF